MRINIFCILFNQNKRKIKQIVAMFVDKQSLIRVNQRQWSTRGLAYFHKQLDVFIVLISMTTDTSFPVAENVSNNEVMSRIPEKTFQSWLKTLDPNGIWIRGEMFDKSAVCIWCALCAKHRKRLRCFHNFTGSATPLSTAFLALLSNVMHCQRYDDCSSPSLVILIE